METKIGLEIHCQLTGAKSKLFCRCSSDYRGKAPNANTCPTCSGLPGTLPLLNQKAVEFAGMISLALGCKIPDEIAFYRKNYFYPDMPKNFQLTQYNAYGITSIGVEGRLGYGDGKSARIRRVQLEEDPGRLVYEGGSMETSVYALIDYNRAGVPLVEIVTEPDFTDPKDVRMFLDKITSIIEHLGVCDTKLEGSVRCDANVSVGGGNRVEIKNVSSFADVEKAVRYEITRQRTMASRDIEVRSETRHWDDARKVTKESRTKEEEQDYRYFPEPDVPAVVLGSEFISSIRQSMPELPDTRKDRFVSKYGISSHVAQVLIDNKELADFFESAIKIYSSPKEIANWLVTDLMSFVDERQKEEQQRRSLFAGLKIGPEHIADLAKLVDQGTINRATAKQILAQVVRTGEMPSHVAKKTQAAKIDDVGALAQAIESVFKSEQAAVQDAKRNPNAANFLLGKVMQATKGRADPKAALEMIQKKLREG
ncbi:aspartyl/glutamyl-tRNA amidotransferase subunit B [Candidatus Nitrososphaera gargensis Ga9.2]|uniref:Aspartyl/glutamyl-tRNA(Asn/Gln) amidotransferase subunit B n=1 Tax=Nitrososphaera gargensis (strain Ga9.2) TaxID=1237085 RepID=K0IEL7_NITGG|nr:Asp-tRNA(Asn)/Glu-tRNA(Gln) amidotransferase subunit GatB [Candidatus Nitrososphaera gargensis]AFU57218.1 aspartyl/glutamyl-tRNA amidotransferase subunit B [Candidatus Nitrososphaera gargensis Ga9.2]